MTTAAPDPAQQRPTAYNATPDPASHTNRRGSPKKISV